jgi:predicted RNase H-like HicB family nuclease
VHQGGDAAVGDVYPQIFADGAQIKIGEVQILAIVHSIKIIVEKHDDGFVAYPIGMNGVVVGEGDSYDEALADARSAIQCHIEEFGADAFPRKPTRS